MIPYSTTMGSFVIIHFHPGFLCAAPGAIIIQTLRAFQERWTTAPRLEGTSFAWNPLSEPPPVRYHVLGQQRIPAASRRRIPRAWNEGAGLFAIRSGLCRVRVRSGLRTGESGIECNCQQNPV